MNKVKFKLSPSSIDSAIADIQNYKKELLNKLADMTYKIALTGYPVVQENYINDAPDSGVFHTGRRLLPVVDGASLDHQVSVSVPTASNRMVSTMRVTGSGVAFIEFGAGVHYNGAVGTSPHPKGQELGMTIGSYGKGKGKNDTWFHTASGRSVMTHGTKAMMPVYKASVEMRKSVSKISREVFGR